MKKLLSMLALTLALTACGDKSNETTSGTSTTEQTVSTPTPQGEVLNVIANLYPPFVINDEHGLPSGFDVDIIKAIAKVENLNIVVTPRTEWSGALDTLSKDESDIVVSAITLTPERAEQYLASNPYVSTPNSVVVPSDSPIQTVDDLKGKVIGLEKGSSILKDKDKFPDTQFNEYKTSFLALSEIARKNVDGVAAQRLHMQYLLSSHKELSVRFIDLPSSASPDKVIMVKKGNTELINKINSGLEKIKADGTYNTIYQKWFGAIQ